MPSIACDWRNLAYVVYLIPLVRLVQLGKYDLLKAMKILLFIVLVFMRIRTQLFTTKFDQLESFLRHNLLLGLLSLILVVTVLDGAKGPRDDLLSLLITKKELRVFFTISFLKH